jgi:hypothetical protein
VIVEIQHNNLLNLHVSVLSMMSTVTFDFAMAPRIHGKIGRDKAGYRVNLRTCVDSTQKLQAVQKDTSDAT